MAGINAEAEQREQLIAETEQRIADLKQQIEKTRAHEVRWTSVLRGPKRSEDINERMQKLRERRAGGRTSADDRIVLFNLLITLNLFYSKEYFRWHQGILHQHE